MSNYARQEFRGRVFYVPIDVATTPIEGWCTVDRWWAAHPENGLVFYHRPFGQGRSEEPSPQCNADKYVSERIIKKIFPGHECVFINIVYLGHAMKVMREDRKQAAKERAA